MAGGPGKRQTGSKNRKHKKYNKAFLREKFEERHIDQVWEDVRKAPTEVVQPGVVGPAGTTARAHHDEDTPGFGKYYCIPCAKYCQNAAALVDHEKSKPHKRRVKMLMNTPRPHNQVDADIASGMGPPDNGPKLRSGGGVAQMAE